MCCVSGQERRFLCRPKRTERLSVACSRNEGDTVVTRWVGHGTRQGKLFGVAPSGTAATMTGIIINRLRDGRIVETRDVLDALGLLRQLGVSSLPAIATAA